MSFSHIVRNEVPRGANRASMQKLSGKSSTAAALTTTELIKYQIPLVDIGANLTNKQFLNDIDQVLARCQQANVLYMILTGTSQRVSHESIQIINQYKKKYPDLHLHSTVGIHPHDAKNARQNTLTHLDALITEHKKEGVVVAVGETGLDFNRMFSPKETQEQMFRQHIELAIKHKLPLILHERDAHDSFVNILKSFEANILPPIVVHCFTGTYKECKVYVDMGFYIGFTGCICKKDRGMELRKIIRSGLIPLDRIMIETDAPYMSPSSAVRRMEPCYLSFVVKTLAQELKKSEEEIAHITTDNSKRFFNI